MRRSGKTDKRTPWDVLAQAAAVFAILLPVVGVGVRAVAFGLSGTVPWWVAVERPPIDLALTGFMATVPALVVGLLAYPVAREFGPRFARLDRVLAEHRRVHSLAYQLRLDADALKAKYQSRYEALGARMESLSARDYDEVRAEIEAELASTEDEFKSDSDALTRRIGELEHDAKRTERLVKFPGEDETGYRAHRGGRGSRKSSLGPMRTRGGCRAGTTTRRARTSCSWRPRAGDHLTMSAPGIWRPSFDDGGPRSGAGQTANRWPRSAPH